MDALIISKSIKSDTTAAESKQEKLDKWRMWSIEPARLPVLQCLLKTSKRKAFFVDYSSAPLSEWNINAATIEINKARQNASQQVWSEAFHMDGSTHELISKNKQKKAALNTKGRTNKCCSPEAVKGQTSSQPVTPLAE